MRAMWCNAYFKHGDFSSRLGTTGPKGNKHRNPFPTGGQLRIFEPRKLPDLGG